MLMLIHSKPASNQLKVQSQCSIGLSFKKIPKFLSHFFFAKPFMIEVVLEILNPKVMCTPLVLEIWPNSLKHIQEKNGRMIVAQRSINWCGWKSDNPDNRWQGALISDQQVMWWFRRFIQVYCKVTWKGWPRTTAYLANKPRDVSTNDARSELLHKLDTAAYDFIIRDIDYQTGYHKVHIARSPQVRRMEDAKTKSVTTTDSKSQDTATCMGKHSQKQPLGCVGRCRRKIFLHCRWR